MDLIEEVRRLLSEEPRLHRNGPAGASGDKDLSRLLANGQPAGTPLRESLRQIYVTKRPAWYKTRAADQYRDATARVRKLYQEIDARAPITGSAVLSLVSSFLPLLKSDRSFLLNLAYLPSSDPDFLYTHAINSSLLSMALATHAGYSEGQAMEIAVSALLLDVGMIRVPAAILNKAGSLSEEEKFEIVKHPIVGADLLHPIPDLPPAASLAIYQHHERLSGSGYPKGRSGHLIHEYSRILAIADTYAAMVCSRSYRAPLLPYQAMEATIKLGGAGLLDARLIRRLLETLSLFPVGSLVRLESGRVGKVIQPGSADFTRPLIAILRHDRGRPALPGTVLDLAKSDGDRIVQALPPGSITQDPMDGF